MKKIAVLCIALIGPYTTQAAKRYTNSVVAEINKKKTDLMDCTEEVIVKKEINKTDDIKTFWKQMIKIAKKSPKKISFKTEKFLEKSNFGAPTLIKMLENMPESDFYEESISTFINTLIERCATENYIAELFSRPGVYLALKRLSNYKQRIFYQQKSGWIYENQALDLREKPRKQSLTAVKKGPKTINIIDAGTTIITIELNDQIAAYCFNKDQKKFAAITDSGILLVWDISSGKDARLAHGCSAPEIIKTQELFFSSNGETIIARDKDRVYWQIGAYLVIEPAIYITLKLLKKHLTAGITIPASITHKNKKSTITEKSWLYKAHENIQKILKTKQYPHKIICMEQGEKRCFKLVAQN